MRRYGEKRGEQEKSLTEKGKEERRKREEQWEKREGKQKGKEQAKRDQTRLVLGKRFFTTREEGTRELGNTSRTPGVGLF